MLYLFSTPYSADPERAERAVEVQEILTAVEEPGGEGAAQQQIRHRHLQGPHNTTPGSSQR
jgi:hypothetical protein